ncbi:MAG: type IV pilus biogenesis protein PilM [Burkholderiales bacterium]|jgi:hypothetical protein|nr:type IV pilus biogenesis protein PilM [Burkholderiales bacterium]
MPALFFSLAALLAWALQLLLFAPDGMQDRTARADAEASSFLVSHQAAADWVTRNGRPPGPVLAAALVFPVGYTTRAEWQHVVVDGRLFSYTRIDYEQPAGFADVLGTVGQSACLRAVDSSDTARCPTGTVALPAAVASEVRQGAAMIVGG